MSKYMRWPFSILALLVVFSTALNAQNFVYTNNDVASANYVSAFSVGSNGALSPIAGSPFPTNGAGSGGGLYSANRIIVVNNFLFASNSGNNTVSAFSIDPNSGFLTPVSGSPFSTGAFNDASNSGISLAATPDGKYLYAGSTGYDLQFNFGPITIFSIGSTGALSTTGSSAAAGGPIYSMKVSPDGKYLAVAFSQYQTSQSQIAVFAIQSDGSLQAVTSSPFTVSSASATASTGVDINCAGNLLYAGGSTGNIYAFSISSGGQLAPVTGSPFAPGPTSNQVVALSTDDKTLFASNQLDNNVYAFALATDGSFTGSVTSAGVGSGASAPGGLAVSKDGTLLYAADTTFTGGFGGISTFTLGGGLPISFASLVSTGIVSQLHSVAAFPAKVCTTSGSTSSGLVASLKIFAGPPPGFDLEATLTLDPKLVVDPLTQVVDIQIGSFSISLPGGSFKWFQNGSNSGTYVFQGVSNGATLKIQITPLGQNQFLISASGKQVDLSGLSSPITVSVGIGGNSASASVAVISGPLRFNSPVK